MILYSDQEGNDCIRKLRCHCIQILHSDIYSVQTRIRTPCMANLTAQGQNVELNTIECPDSMHLYHQDNCIADKLQKTNWA